MTARSSDVHEATSPHLLALRAELRAQTMRVLTERQLGDLSLQLCEGADSVWLVIARKRNGGLAIRTAYIPGGSYTSKFADGGSNAWIRLDVQSHLGTHLVTIGDIDLDQQRLRVSVSLTPAQPLSPTFAPRDFYPFDASFDPLESEGSVEAAQRGLNAGLLYVYLPPFGCALYFQELTALNDYYETTQTSPDGAVGGEWPELGYLLPTEATDGKPHALPQGAEVTLSDAVIVLRPCAIENERGSARLFIQMLADIYPTLDRPPVTFRDWPDRAERTLNDLACSPKATVRKYGATFARPYTDAERPDSMVQLSLLTAMHDYGIWRGQAAELEADFRKGLSRFYDPKLGALRRYLPHAGDDRDADAVDSWYLYHPLLNLCYLALAGDRSARKLLLKSLDFAIKAAHHFEYCWPIQYNIRDFSVITASAADGRGQTDVGGLYAQLMLKVHQLTGDERFLGEAKAAIDAATGLRFNLNYQANLTAWGAAACMRLWRLTSDERYLDQSYVYLASFFHNSEIWESQIGHAIHYKNFLGVTCLQDAPYMAIYECFDSFAAFECYLSESGPELDPAARLLVGEYCKYALDRAWYYYPDALPVEALATKQRNGTIDRNLSFPLEDLYADGQPAGQVGQEIYGAGAAWVFASRAFHRLSDAPFRIFCDHFLFSIERCGARAVGLRLPGDARASATISLIREKRKKLPAFKLRAMSGKAVQPSSSSNERTSFIVPADAHLLLSWD